MSENTLRYRNKPSDLIADHLDKAGRCACETGKYKAMTLKSRIEHLERTSAHRLKVAYPILCDADGNEFDCAPLDDCVEEVRFVCAGQTTSAVRSTEEETESFFARARRHARETLNPTVILPNHVDWL